MKKISLLLICLCAVLHASAQYYTNQNKIWAFGNNAGLDFNSGTPVPFHSSINMLEGSAAVCNTAGQLLFYTDGLQVFNRLGGVMPGGLAIVPFETRSTTQAAVIVPFVNDTNKFYVFSLESYMPTAPRGRLAYSFVDMTLDGGLGDIIPGAAGIILDSGMSEKMISVAGDGCNIWLLTHKKDTAQICAYNITGAGISTTPAISNVGTFSGVLNYEIGVMKCSHDRQKLVTVSHKFGPATKWGIELYDFNPATGIVSNCQVLDSNSGFGIFYGAEFSPDNTKLYVTNLTPDSGIRQWNISLPTTAAIIASKYSIPGSEFDDSDLKLGPDNKIYINHQLNGHFLDRIDFPNAPGPACGFSDSAIDIAPYTTKLGFTNTVWTKRPLTMPGVAPICSGTTTTLSVSAAGGTWNSSDTGVAKVNSAGVVSGIAPGNAVISFTSGSFCNGSTVVTVNPAPAPIVGPTTVALGATITLTNTTLGGTWSSSDTTKVKVNATGKVTGIALGTATIYYTLPTGCQVSVVINVVKNTSVNTIETHVKPTLYPNPATSEIGIKADHTAFTSLTIYNTIGQLMSTHEITEPEMKVDVKVLPPGQYQVIFRGDGLREMLRFVKW